MPRYAYKDFATGRPTYTRGSFTGWLKGGPLDVFYAVFVCRRTEIMVPEYCLTPETRRDLKSRIAFPNAGAKVAPRISA